MIVTSFPKLSFEVGCHTSIISQCPTIRIVGGQELTKVTTGRSMEESTANAQEIVDALNDPRLNIYSAEMALEYIETFYSVQNL